MPLILRAIITGFGYKLGSELGRWVIDKTVKRKRKAEDDEEAEGLPKDAAQPVQKDDEKLPVAS